MFGNKCLVKSGGLATQLVKYVGKKIFDDPLLSSRFDAENPDAVIQTQLDFLNNGAQIIQTNTYQASVEGFMRHLQVSREEAILLIRNSVKVTKTARDQFLAETEDYIEPGLPLVVASIGPYGALFHDYSDYTGSYADSVTVKEIQDFHRPRLEACLAEGVDSLGIETIPCQMEAEIVVDMILDEFPDSKFYISFQCKNDTNLAHGEIFADVVSVIWKKIEAKSATDRCIGIGVNCVNPRNVSNLFRSLHPSEKGVVPLLVYSNRDEFYNATAGKWEETESPRPLESYVPEWFELGAKIIGGCCRVYPEDILKIRQCIDNLQNPNSGLKETNSESEKQKEKEKEEKISN